MTIQEIFDKSVIGVIKQGKKSLDLNGCAYRGFNGNKCAIGHLITDDHYNKKLEGCTAGEILVDNALEASINTKLNDTLLSMLLDLQRAHDYSDFSERYFLNDFIAKVTNICKKYSLFMDNVNKHILSEVLYPNN